MVNRSTAFSEHKFLKRIQFRLVVLYLLAFLALEVAVISCTYIILSHQIMIPKYESIMEEWTQLNTEAIQKLDAYQHGDQHVEMDSGPEVIANWVIAPNGHIVIEDTSLSSAMNVDMQSAALQLSKMQGVEADPIWTTPVLDGTPVLAGVNRLYKNGQLVGTVVSFRSLIDVHDDMETVTHIDIVIGLLGVLMTVPITYWLAQRSLDPIRTAMHRQRNFVNDAAHELRTPLAILYGTLELVQGEKELPMVQQAIRESLAEAEYITDLIANLSTLARLESGTTELNIRQVNLTELVKDTLTSLQSFAKKRDIQLTAEGFEDEAWLEGDATRLRQLLFILVDNALKYTPEGGQVCVTVRKHRTQLEMTVSDTGIGIPEEDLSHIFDRFYRATFVANQAHGSGIGLAIAAWIVEAHHGQIKVQSNEAIGTSFLIILPVLPNLGPLQKVLHTKGSVK